MRFLHTFEWHVIYGMHFHAQMKHVVPLTEASAAITSELLDHFPHAFFATLRYQSVSSFINFQMGIILLPLNCINVEIWIVCVYTQ